MENGCAPVKKWLVKVFRVDEEAFSHKLLRGIFTFALIDISWIFFRNPFIQSLKILFRIAGLNTDTYWFTWGNNLEAMGAYSSVQKPFSGGSGSAAAGGDLSV